MHHATDGGVEGEIDIRYNLGAGWTGCGIRPATAEHFAPGPKFKGWQRYEGMGFLLMSLLFCSLTNGGFEKGSRRPAGRVGRFPGRGRDGEGRRGRADRRRVEPSEREALPGQIFWSRADNRGFSEPKSARFGIIADGRFHTYKVRLAGHPEWRGIITRLRLDLKDKPGLRVEIDWMRLE